MFSLDPEKLLIVLVLALILLGPDKLPKLARQLGAGWGRVRALHQRLEEEVRNTVPDLPSSAQLARMVRSPVSYLNTLADEHSGKTNTDGTAGSAGEDDRHEAWPADPGDPTAQERRRLAESSNVAPGLVPADPSMN
jgi:Sec-independent protein translocase protein TatA